MSDKYVVASFRRSFKRDGWLGNGWMVVDQERKVAVAKVDTRAQAEAVVAAITAGTDPDDLTALRGVVRSVPA